MRVVGPDFPTRNWSLLSRGFAAESVKVSARSYDWNVSQFRITATVSPSCALQKKIYYFLGFERKRELFVPVVSLCTCTRCVSKTFSAYLCTAAKYKIHHFLRFLSLFFCDNKNNNCSRRVSFLFMSCYIHSVWWKETSQGVFLSKRYSIRSPVTESF